jgi:hypothetical protein
MSVEISAWRTVSATGDNASTCCCAITVVAVTSGSESFPAPNQQAISVHGFPCAGDNALRVVAATRRGRYVGGA